MSEFELKTKVGLGRQPISTIDTLCTVYIYMRHRTYIISSICVVDITKLVEQDVMDEWKNK